MAQDDDAYAEGHLAGQVAARLAQHDKHFAQINGSLDRLSGAVEAQTLAIQRLGDQAVSRDATVVVTAAALRDAEEARRTQSETSWSPLSRTATALGALAAVGTLLGYLAYVKG